MKNHPVGAPHFRRSAAAALLLALMAGNGAFAQAPVTTQPVTAQSGSPAATPSESAPDIRDIRGPKPIRSAWLIPLIAMTVLLSGASVYATWRWYRRRAQPQHRTPLEIALARLESARALMQPDLGRDFSIEVSGIVREYIESRFAVMAAHLTTHEFLHDSLGSRDPVLAANRVVLAEFLEACDLAKFGGWNLSLQTMETMLQSARRFFVESAAERSDAAKRTPATSTRATGSPSVTPRETYDSIPST
jgi:hypothetical protein